MTVNKIVVVENELNNEEKEAEDCIFLTIHQASQSNLDESDFASKLLKLLKTPNKMPYVVHTRIHRFFAYLTDLVERVFSSAGYSFSHYREKIAGGNLIAIRVLVVQLFLNTPEPIGTHGKYARHDKVHYD